ncbi:MAG: aminotransferase class III-fold pyridoxal phosphate-dependent enzyme [Oscillospiraceae bacterium]
MELVSGKGSLVYDEKGKEYIDMGSGIGVTAFGIADEEWKQAVIEQLGKLQHMSNLYYTEPCAILAKMLCEKTGMKKVFFANSGAEANECVIKAAANTPRREGRRLLHHSHPGKQLPRPHHHHPGRHRPGALPRAVPASNPRFCLRQGRRL